MSLADRKKEFLAVRTARGLAARKLFEEQAPGALEEAVLSRLWRTRRRRSGHSTRRRAG